MTALERRLMAAFSTRCKIFFKKNTSSLSSVVEKFYLFTAFTMHCVFIIITHRFINFVDGICFQRL